MIRRRDLTRQSTHRPIVLSICEWGVNQPWDWAPTVGNLWRTTDDVSDNWPSMLSNLDQSAQHSAVARPGARNDPDMLEIGNGGMTADEYRAHLSLWAVQAAPLIAGNDLRTMSAETRSILTNPEVIAVDQDSLGAQGTLVSSGPPERQVWSKRLQDGSRAVVLLNRGTTVDSIKVSFRRAGVRADSASVRDLWRHEDRGRFRGSYTAVVRGHAAVMVRIKP